jgi:uncharacterized membrane protein YccF (DUF307 family)
MVLIGSGKIRGLRLFGKLPQLAWPLLPGLKFVADIDRTIDIIEKSEQPSRSPALRLIYALLIGWWLSLLIVLIAWVLMMTLAAVPAAQQLHTLVLRFATLARYRVPW